MKDALFLTLDMGTSSVRAMLFDVRGRPVPDAEVQIPYRQTTSADGGVQTDAEPLLDRTVDSMRQLLRAQGKAVFGRIAGVGISCFWHSLMGVGKDGRAVTPLYSWADNRARAQAADLAHVLDPVSYHARTGCVLHPCYWPAKLCWLHQTQPDLFGSVQTWMSFGEYVMLRLFGQASCSLSMASGTGLLDQNKAQWDAQTLAVLPIQTSQLNPLTDRNASQSGLTSEFARVLAPLRTVPWFPAVGDGACSNAGCGATAPTRIAINMGTSGAMRVAVEADTLSIPPGLFCYRMDGRRFLVGGAFANGGNVYAWQQTTLNLSGREALSPALSKLPPDGSGLTVLPFWAGERSPGWHADARAAILGMNLHTAPLDIMHASLEAVGYQFATVHDLLLQQFPQGCQIIASGGALTHDPAWTQILADIFGMPISASKIGEATSRGAALLAAESLGLRRDLSHIPTYLGRTYKPDAARHAVYQKARARYQSLYEQMIEGRHS